MAIRIIVVDDNPLYLDTLSRVLGKQEEFQILAGCGTGEEALSAMRRERADVLLIDNNMPGMSGLDVLRAIRDEQLPVRAVLMSGLLKRLQVAEAVRLGASGIILKGMSAQSLFKCIRVVHGGGRWLEPGLSGRGVEQLSSAKAKSMRSVPVAPNVK